MSNQHTHALAVSAQRLRERQARIARIKAEIAAGTYLTDEKLGVAFDRLAGNLMQSEHVARRLRISA